MSTHGYSQNQILVWKYPSLTQVAKLTGHSYRVLYLVSLPPRGLGEHHCPVPLCSPCLRVPLPGQPPGLDSRMGSCLHGQVVPPPGVCFPESLPFLHSSVFGHTQKEISLGNPGLSPRLISERFTRSPCALDEGPLLSADVLFFFFSEENVLCLKPTYHLSDFTEQTLSPCSGWGAALCFDQGALTAALSCGLAGACPPPLAAFRQPCPSRAACRA